MLSLRSLRLRGAAVLLLLPLTSCGDSKGGAGDPTGSEERLVATALSDAQLVPGEVATLIAAEPIFTAETYTIAAEGAGSIELHSANDSTLNFTIPIGTPAGSYTLELVEDDDWRVSFAVQVQPAIVIANPDVVVDETLAEVDSMIAEVAALVADTSMPDPGGLQLVYTLSERIAAWRDTASAESLNHVATILAANPGVFGVSAGTSPGASFASALENCDSVEEDPAAIFVACQQQATLSVGRAVVAVIAATAVCSIEPTMACAISGAAAITAVVLAKGWVVKLADQPAVIVDRVFASFSEDADGAPHRVASALADTALFMNGRQYTLSVAAPYRSIVAADATEHAILAAAIDAIDTLDDMWQKGVDLVEAVREVLTGTIPSLPAAPGSAPAQPHTTVDAQLDVASIAIANVSASVDVDFDAATGAFTVTTDEAGDVPFSFDVVYEYEFDTVVTTHFGRVTPGSVVVAFAGGGQQGKPGAALDDSLVVRVSSLVDGSHVANAQVTWSVQSGGGTISGESVTDANGFARAHWTLGASEGTQSASAAVQLADGSVPSGSPVVFESNATLTLQLVKVLGDDQIGEPGVALELPLVARVVDQDLMPIAGRTIEWRIVSGDGQISSTSTLTNASGEGEVIWTMGQDTTGVVEASLLVNGNHVQGSPILFSASIASGPGTYEMTIIPSLGIGSSYPKALNGSGHAVGYELSSGNASAWIWQGGASAQPVTIAGAVSVQPHALSETGLVGVSFNTNTGSGAASWNNGSATPLQLPTGHEFPGLYGGTGSGDLVGSSYDPATGKRTALRWTPQGTMTVLPNPGAHSARAYGALDGGISVGSTSPPIGDGTGLEAALWTGTSYQALPDDNGDMPSEALEINSAGVVVGWRNDAPGCSGPAMWVNGLLQPLPRLTGQCAEIAEAINTEGLIVGAGQIQPAAILWFEGDVYDLGQLVVNLNGAVLQGAYDINDNGQILANAMIGGVLRAVILTPQ